MAAPAMVSMTEVPDHSEDEAPVDFCTLGMFIIDEIHPHPKAADQTVQKDIIGGAGTYSALGARLFSPAPTLSRRVAWIVDAGPDFPARALATIESWDTAVLVRARSGLTTRGWNGYSGNEVRAFAYATPKLRLTAADLSARMLRSGSFHLIAGAERCAEQVRAIRAARRGQQQQHAGTAEAAATTTTTTAEAVIIWEPVPDLCTPSELERTCAALAHVDVVSPNHAELAALFGFSHGEGGVVRGAVEAQARSLMERGGVGPRRCGAVVVRAGAEGCYVLTSTVSRWLPAFHRDAKRVVDPTGGGNGFLGGFAVGLVRSGGDVVEAARWGSVAASFAIEQVGMPRLEQALGASGSEKWNGEVVLDRLEEFRARTA